MNSKNSNDSRMNQPNYNGANRLGDTDEVTHRSKSFESDYQVRNEYKPKAVESRLSAVENSNYPPDLLVPSYKFPIVFKDQSKQHVSPIASYYMTMLYPPITNPEWAKDFHNWGAENVDQSFYSHPRPLDPMPPGQPPVIPLLPPHVLKATFTASDAGAVARINVGDYIAVIYELHDVPYHWEKKVSPTLSIIEEGAVIKPFDHPRRLGASTTLRDIFQATRPGTFFVRYHYVPHHGTGVTKSMNFSVLVY